MEQKIFAVKGMNDILPQTSYQWLWLEDLFSKFLFSYGYKNLRTPIIENTKLYTRSIGEITDIVQKEMYSFNDQLNNDDLSLRPEGTAGTIRAVIEHNLTYNKPQKLWFMGAMYRHERPQKGRYRQFHQLSVEAIGFKGAEIDSELILMLHQLWQQLGIKNLQLQLNCLGNSTERALHRQQLIKYLEQNYNLLDTEAQTRIYNNPLRILDSKNPDLQELLIKAPSLLDFLTEESIMHHELWKKYLNDLAIPFVENHRLVRGLDYYNLSVFEWISTDLGAQNTICAGGRYDPLIKQLGGRDSYASGFAIGIERLLLVLEAQNLLPLDSNCDIYLICTIPNAWTYSSKIATILRSNGYSVIQNINPQSFKSQLKSAANHHVIYSLIVGENELNNSTVMIKSMINQFQQSIKLDNLLIYLGDNKNGIF